MGAGSRSGSSEGAETTLEANQRLRYGADQKIRSLLTLAGRRETVVRRIYDPRGETKKEWKTG